MKLPIQVDLKDKVCVVTGGTGILGSFWAEALALAGAKVAVLGRDINKAKEVAAQLSKDGKTVIGVEADVLNKESLKKAHELGSINRNYNQKRANWAATTLGQRKDDGHSNLTDHYNKQELASAIRRAKSGDN